MSIAKFYKQSFTPYTMAEATTFPYDLIETAGTNFKGALDLVGSDEKWADAALVALSTHWISCATSVSVTQGMKIGLGSRRFEVMGKPDPVLLKGGHHQEIYVKEIT